jgi:hypothetical protein
MDTIQIVKDFDKYINETLNNYLDQNWKYYVELNQYNKDVEIILSDVTELSIISSYALDQTELSQNIISDFEAHVIEYLTANVPNIMKESISFTYEYDSVVIKFKLSGS